MQQQRKQAQDETTVTHVWPLVITTGIRNDNYTVIYRGLGLTASQVAEAEEESSQIVDLPIQFIYSSLPYSCHQLMSLCIPGSIAQ
jgi:hypothetical protein